DNRHAGLLSLSKYELKRKFGGCDALHTRFRKVRLHQHHSAETVPGEQVPNPSRRTAMTKLVLAAIAALSILSSPVLAAPGGSYDDIVQKSGDFQLQGR